MNIINITQFIEEINMESDMTPIVFSALQACKEVENPVLVFQKGTYHFWPDRAYEKFYFMSNNDQGLKRIAFPLLNMQHLTIDGGNSEFIFHGRVLPFLFDRSKNITVKNVNIDYQYPFYACGEIVEAAYDFIDLKINRDDYPYRIEGENIQFYCDEWEGHRVFGLLELDSKTLTPAYKIGDEWFNDPKDLKIEEIEDGIVRFKSKYSKLHNIGNLMVISHEKRLNPAFFSTNSADVAIENVNIYHTGAMGIIVQLTHNVSINKVNVVLREGSKRVISAIADATHFVNCTGLVKVEDCVFEHQKDDPLNVHGTYTLVSGIYEPNVIEVEFIHYQQNGVELYSVGDRISFVNRKSMLTYHTATIKEVIPVNQKYIRLVLKENVADHITKGVAVENASKMPDLVIRNCKVGKNRARGFLITTPGNVLVENNNIYTSGAGILITGDCNYWFESGPVKDVVIRKNKFVDCGYGPWGRAVIDINPKIPGEQVEEGCYHSNVIIEDNHFKTFDMSILAANSVDGLKFANNLIEKTTTFEPYKCKDTMLEIKTCQRVTVTGNQIIGFDEVALVDEIK